MLDGIVIKNYRTFREFRLKFDPSVNILVGDNDAGKSTLLEAIGLALTGRLHGRPLSQELSPYLFHQDAAREYTRALREGGQATAPEIVIDLFMDPGTALPRLRGTNNLLRLDQPGVRIRVSLSGDFDAEYREFISRPELVTQVPTEYYRVEWLDFGGNPITQWSVGATASLIDASGLHLQAGVDYYMRSVFSSHLETAERVELARTYRSLRESFAEDGAIKKINERLRGAPREVSSRELTLGIDVSQRSNWESSLVPHLDELPFQYVGQGEQSTLKILLALNQKLDKAHVVLVEEPENHLSFPNLGRLVRQISDTCAGRQVFIATHSSFVLNKLGLENLILLSRDQGYRLGDLPTGTQDYFKKLSGYDTLRVVLAKRSILVEGPSDELVVQRAYLDAHGRLPAEDGVDVINVRGLSFKRFLDISALLTQNQVTVVTDNDGNPPQQVASRYTDYTRHNHIKVCVGHDPRYKTLEPQLLAANSREVINQVLGTDFTTDEELLAHMLGNKTTCALAIFDSPLTITMPEYIRDAVV